MIGHIVAPSILAADFARLGEEARAVLDAGADWIHFDVMDNHYVPNLTIGPAVLHALRKYGITAPIDVHLMVKPVDDLVLRFAESGASSISFHPDATDNIFATIELIRKQNCKVGIALNPSVNLDILPSLEDKIDILLLMSVNPGFGGQKFMPQMLDKAIAARKMLDMWQLQVRLQMDGGINLDNIAQIYASGVDTIVAGNAIFSHPQENYANIIAQLK